MLLILIPLLNCAQSTNNKTKYFYATNIKNDILDEHFYDKLLHINLKKDVSVFIKENLFARNSDSFQKLPYDQVKRKLAAGIITIIETKIFDKNLKILKIIKKYQEELIITIINFFDNMIQEHTIFNEITNEKERLGFLLLRIMNEKEILHCRLSFYSFLKMIYKMIFSLYQNECGNEMIDILCDDSIRREFSSQQSSKIIICTFLIEKKDNLSSIFDIEQIYKKIRGEVIKKNIKDQNIVIYWAPDLLYMVSSGLMKAILENFKKKRDNNSLLYFMNSETKRWKNMFNTYKEIESILQDWFFFCKSKGIIVCDFYRNNFYVDLDDEVANMIDFLCKIDFENINNDHSSKNVANFLKKIEEYINYFYENHSKIYKSVNQKMDSLDIFNKKIKNGVNLKDKIKKIIGKSDIPNKFSTNESNRNFCSRKEKHDTVNISQIEKTPSEKAESNDIVPLKEKKLKFTDKAKHNIDAEKK